MPGIMKCLSVTSVSLWPSLSVNFCTQVYLYDIIDMIGQNNEQRVWDNMTHFLSYPSKQWWSIVQGCLMYDYIKNFVYGNCTFFVVAGFVKNKHEMEKKSFCSLFCYESSLITLTCIVLSLIGVTYRIIMFNFCCKKLVNFFV